MSTLDEQRGRYIDLLLARAERCDDVAVRERCFDRLEAILFPPASPAAPAAAPRKRHPRGVGWIDMLRGRGVAPPARGETATA